MLLSSIGDGVFNLALAWMVAEATGSGLVLASVLIVQGVPRLIFMLLGGVAVDRMDARRLMIASDVLRAAVLLGLMAFSIGGAPPLWAIYAFSFIFGTVDAVYWPAERALRQRLVPPEQFTQANSLLIGGTKAAGLAGPLLGAALLAWGGYRGAMVADAASFAISAATLLVVTLRPAEKTALVDAKRSIWGDMLAGMRFVWRSPLMLASLFVILIANMGVNSTGVGLPFLVQKLGLGADGLAHMEVGLGLGGLVGATVLALLVIKRPTPRMAMLAFFLQGAAIALVTFAPSQWVVAGLLSLVGLTSIVIEVLLTSIYQAMIPAELMGRVFSFLILFSMGSTPVGQALAGWLTDLVGPFQVFLYAGLLAMAATGVALCLPAIRHYDSRATADTMADQASEAG